MSNALGKTCQSVSVGPAQSIIHGFDHTQQNKNTTHIRYSMQQYSKHAQAQSII